MEKYLSLEEDGLEIIERDGHYYVRYDAGSQNNAWREDEISEDEVAKIKSARAGEYEVIIELQKRLIRSGIDPYVSNWTPTEQRGSVG